VAARRARDLRDQQAGEHPQALRRHLIAVTQQLLAAHGLTGLTTRGIAREAQVSDGVLYNHFADKDELIVAALAEQVGDLTARFLADCPTPGAQDLRTGLTALVRLSRQFQAESLPLLSGLLSRPDLMHAVLDRVHTGDRAAQLLWVRIQEYLAGEQELGTVAAHVDPHVVTHVIFGTGHLQVLADVVAPGLTEVPTGDPLDGVVDFLVRACEP